jgi:L-lactate dehydrogenase (cytochrome)
VYVSNHGRRNVDQALSTIEALPAVVDVVDGGLSRGADVCRAISLG